MNTVEVFWGEEPRVESEKKFLRQLIADLNREGVSALILANFFTGSSSRQVDFLVITDNRVCHVELKGYREAIFGTTNGPWSSRRSDGALVVIDRQNPYTQALGCKMAISDDMHALADQDRRIPRHTGERFFTRIDSVICVSPSLAEESQVPGDYKVQTLGYAEFWRLLVTPSRQHPGWKREHWLALVRRLALTRVGADSGQMAHVNAAQEIAAEYCQRFGRFYRQGLHELVSTPLRLDGEATSASQVCDAVREGNHVQLIGPSGSGKSHLAKHSMLSLLDSGSLVIYVEAGMYEGRLSTLLNRSIARFSTANFEELLQAAAIDRRLVLLILDGYNECAQTLRDRLIGDLSALCLRFPLVTFSTSQTEIPLSGVL